MTEIGERPNRTAVTAKTPRGIESLPVQPPRADAPSGSAGTPPRGLYRNAMGQRDGVVPPLNVATRTKGLAAGPGEGYKESGRRGWG
jgi:hypothetical protein